MSSFLDVESAIKGTDEGYTSTSLTNDSDLSIPITLGTWWFFMALEFSEPNFGDLDIKMDFTLPAGTTGKYATIQLLVGTLGTNLETARNSITDEVVYPVLSAPTTTRLEATGQIEVLNIGVLQARFAQVAAFGGFPTTVLKGSNIMAMKAI